MASLVEEFSDLAKTSILTNGHIEPAFFAQVEGAPKPHLIVMQSNGKTAYERAVECFASGRRFATQVIKKKQQLASLVYASQVARVKPSQPLPKGLMVHPDQGSEIQISTIDLKTETQACLAYEIIRDQQGTPVDLLQVQGASTGMFELALPCFLRGVRTAKRPYSEAIHEVRRVYERFMSERFE